MRLSDFIADYFSSIGTNIFFAITGAGNIRVIESLSKNKIYLSSS